MCGDEQHISKWSQQIERHDTTRFNRQRDRSLWVEMLLVPCTLDEDQYAAIITERMFIYVDKVFRELMAEGPKIVIRRVYFHTNRHLAKLGDLMHQPELPPTEVSRHQKGGPRPPGRLRVVMLKRSGGSKNLPFGVGGVVKWLGFGSYKGGSGVGGACVVGGTVVGGDWFIVKRHIFPFDHPSHKGVRG